MNGNMECVICEGCGQALVNHGHGDNGLQQR